LALFVFFKVSRVLAAYAIFDARGADEWMLMQVFLSLEPS